MLRKRLPFVLFLSVIAALPNAQASNIKRRPQNFAPSSLPYIWTTDAAMGSGAFAMPSSPDNWLGGTGNWSNGADWSAGLPGGSSDVTINTGNDTVTLDTSANINSLTLGGSSGSSQLTGDGNARTLTIAGALTVNQSGNLYLSNDAVSAGANFTNLGTVSVEFRSALQVNGNASNVGTLNEGEGNDSSGNSFAVAGTLTNSGTMNIGYYNFASGGSGTVTAGALSNSGTINLAGAPAGMFQVNGDAINSGTISLNASATLSIAGNLTNSGGLGTVQEDSGIDQVLVAGTLTNTNTGSVGLSGAGNLYQVGTLVNQGQIDLSPYSDSYVTFAITGDACNSGTIDVVGGLGFATFSVGGTFTNSVGGQLNVNNGSEFSAGSLVNNGNLQTSDNGNLDVNGAINNTGTIGTVDGAVQAASLTNSGSIQLGGPSRLQVSGNVDNSGSIATSGNYSNTVSIAGKLTNSSSGTFSLAVASDLANIGYVSNAGNFFLGAGTTVNVTGGAHAAVTALPGFLNSGIVDISSGSTLSDALTYTQTAGQTTVDGTLHVSARGVVNFAGGEVYGNQGTIQGSITNNAAINIGDGPQLVGAMTFMGNYTQGANGSITFDIAGPAAGQYDQLNISGHAQLNGLMTVDLLHGYIPQLGNTFDIMNFASESGTFSMVVGLPINSQEHFTLEYNSTNLTLDVVSGPSQGASSGNAGSEPFITSAGENSAPYSLTASNQAAPDPAPEPGSIFLFGAGVVGLGLRFYRTR